MNKNKPLDKLIIDLKERAKELNCLYEIQELLSDKEADTGKICRGIVNAIPLGWQFSDVCQAKIIYRDSVFKSGEFEETSWKQCAYIKVQDEIVGRLCVYYTEERPQADEGPFLKEERKLIETISEQFGLYILHKQLKSVFEKQQRSEKEQKSEWGVILDLLKRTDPKLLIRISRKMVNFLCWSGIKEAERLLERFSPAYKEQSGLLKEANRPYQVQAGKDLLSLSYQIFKVAGEHLSEQEVLESIQKWIKEDRSGFLVNVLEDTGTLLAEISGAIERYHHLAPRRDWNFPPLAK